MRWNFSPTLVPQSARKSTKWRMKHARTTVPPSGGGCFVEDGDSRTDLAAAVGAVSRCFDPTDPGSSTLAAARAWLDPGRAAAPKATGSKGNSAE
jgi:hypothetical protein